MPDELSAERIHKAANYKDQTDLSVRKMFGDANAFLACEKVREAAATAQEGAQQ